MDKVLPPKKLVLALPASNQEPTLSGGVMQFAEGEQKTIPVIQVRLTANA